MDTGEALRIIDADANRKNKKKETREDMIERFNVTPPEELFEVQKVKIKFNESQMPGKLHTSEFCSFCGDRVADGYHLIVDGEIVCKSCADGAYYEVIDDD